MPKRITVLVAVLLLTLTGCAEATDNAAGERTAPAASEPAAPATVEPTAPDATDDETWFLTETAIAKVEGLSDDEKIAAGYYACEQVGAGNLDVVAVDGLEPGFNEFIVADATAVLCPELADVVVQHQTEG